MITSSCVKLMEWCFKSLGGVVNHATLQKTHTQTILLATGRNYPYTKHNWAFHILLRSITFPLSRDFLDCLPGSPRSFSSNFSHLCLSACWYYHFFPKAQVAPNKNVHKFWHCFLAQHFMSTVLSVLLLVVALETIFLLPLFFWLSEIFWPINVAGWSWNRSDTPN